MFVRKLTHFLKTLRTKATSDSIYILLLLLLSAVTFNWFHGQQYISAGDSTWPFDFKLFFERSKYIWEDINAPGFIRSTNLANLFPLGVYGYLFELAGVPSYVFQRVFYFVSFFFSGFGVFLLLGKLRIKNFSAFVASIFYMFSPYALIAVWNPSYGRIFPFYAFLPLAMYLFLNYLDSRSYFNITLSLSLCLTVLSLLGASFNNPVYFILFVSSIVLFAFMFKSLTPDLSRTVIFKKAIIYLFLYVSLNSYWLLPFVVNLKVEYTTSDNSTAGLVADFETRKINSVSLVDALRMDGLWAKFGGDKEDFYYTFNKYWDSPTYIFLSFVFLPICVSSLLKKKNKTYAIILGFFLFIVFLCSGLKWNFGLGKVTDYFYFGYMGRALRVVYIKLGIFLVIPLTILMGFSLQKLTKWRKYIGVFVLTASFINGFAFFTGDVIKPRGNRLPGHAMSIPQNYIILANYLNNNRKVDRILVLPISTSYNYLFFSKNFFHNGVYFMQYLSSEAFIFRGSLPYVKELSADLNKGDYSLTHVDYILVHKDIPQEDMGRYLTESGVDFVSNVKKKVELKTVIDNENYTLYEVVKLVLDSGVSMQKVSSVLYKVDVLNTSIPVVLSQSYSRGWVLRGRNIAEYSTRYKNYWNSWNVNSPGEYTIYFEPQNRASTGVAISLASFSVLVCYILGRCVFKFLKMVKQC